MQNSLQKIVTSRGDFLFYLSYSKKPPFRKPFNYFRCLTRNHGLNLGYYETPDFPRFHFLFVQNCSWISQVITFAGFPFQADPMTGWLSQ